MRKFTVLFVCIGALGLAQDNPLSASLKMQFGQAKTNIVKAAEKMPEEHYGFQPTSDVRTFAQLVGHVANAQYMFCSAILGEKSPNAVNIEKEKSAKADLVAALNSAFAYCEKAYDGMTDAKAVQAVKFFGRDNANGGVAAFNNMHNYEHYGNMVTYMRLKGIVPPSSEPRPAAPKK